MNASAILWKLVFRAIVISLTCNFVSLSMASPENVLVNNPAADLTSRDTQCGTSIVLGTGSTVIVSFNDSGSLQVGNHFTGWSRSIDGGGSFTDSGALPNTAVGDAGYPCLARDNVTGTIYLSTLGFTQGIQVVRSTDNGASFTTPTVVAPTGIPDLPVMTVDNVPGASQGTIYLAWRNFNTPMGIQLARSFDHGFTFTPPALIQSASAGNVHGAALAVGPDHALYLAYLDESGTSKTLKVKRSTDFGLTFGPPATVTTISALQVNGGLGLEFAAFALPKFAINPVSGNLYIVYADRAAPDRCDIFFTQSTDQGMNWSPAVRVNSDPTTNDQFQPTLAVTPDGTRLFVGFYDRRLDLGNRTIDVFGSIATISGSTVTFGTNARINTESFPPAFAQDPSINPTFVGLYDTATADNNFFYYPWGDNRLGNNFHAHQPDIRMARIPVTGIGSNLSLMSTILTDGNGNGSMDASECNTIAITLQNNGDVPASGVIATLVSNMPELTVTQPFSIFPDLGPGSSATGFPDFQCSTSPAYNCNAMASLTVNVGTGQGNYSFPISYPSMTLPTVPFENNTPVAIPDSNTVTANLNISGFTGGIGRATVSLYATHTFTGDLSIDLVSPDNTSVTLINRRGGSGDNIGTSCMDKTTFDDHAETNIGLGHAPFVGAYKPETPLSVLAGKSGAQVNGTWQLVITDHANVDTGNLECWSVNLAPDDCAPGPGDCETVCSTSINPAQFTFVSAGGSGVAAVTSNCPWVPIPSDSWISISSFTSNSVSFNVSANGLAPRSGTISIGGELLSVQQQGSCSYSLSPAQGIIPAAGGAGNVNMAALNGCPWNATVDAPWVTLNTVSGSGNGIISYNVQPNPIAANRSAHIQAGAQSHEVLQWGDGPDLTGSWIFTPLKCKTKNTGQVCSVKGSFNIANIGTKDAGKFTAKIYVSTDGTLNTATLLKTQKIKKVKTGASISKRANVKLPAGTGPGLFIICVIDSEGAVPEFNRTNNSFTSVPLAI